MSPSVETQAAIRPRAVVSAPAHLGQSAAVAALVFLAATAGILALRRLAGVLAQPLPSAALIGLGAMAAAVVAAIRLQGFPSRIDRAATIAASSALAVLAWSLSIPGSGTVGLLSLWGILAAEEIWAWRRRSRVSRATPRRVIPPKVRLDAPHARVPRVNLPIDAEADALPDGVTQRLTRSQAADGSEGLSGWLRLAFAPGQRTGSLHVAFCPPLAESPELEIEQIDGPEVRIKTGQRLPFGVRLDLKLAAATEAPTNVVLQFSARTRPKAEEGN